MPDYQDISRHTPAGVARAAVLEIAQWDRDHPQDPWEWSDSEDYGYLTDAMSVQHLDEALLETARIKRACDVMLRRLRSLMLRDIDEQGAIRIGNTIYMSAPNRERTVTDPQALALWLDQDWHRAVRVDGSNVRITTIRQIAEARGQDPQAVEDTFFGWKEGEGRKLQELPADSPRTPKWAQQLAEGERRA